MTNERLQLHSERFPPTGTMAADGVGRLLGAPSLDRLETVIRETVQNSNDAALKDGGPPVYLLRLRDLEEAERSALAERFLKELPDIENSAGPIRRFLGGPVARVMEIADFRTSGLGGPNRADLRAGSDGSTDFIDFMRNLGSRRDTDLGGGTYGFGKSSLYLAGRCRSILVDTLSSSGGRPVRRLMGAHIGQAFERWKGSDGGRFTGRHWWGRVAEDGIVDPVENTTARDMAAKIGMPLRNTGETGTTILIPDPDLGEMDEDTAIARIQEIILWNFWPKMVRIAEADPEMRFRIQAWGREVELPDPAEFPPLHLFVRSFQKIMENDSSVIPVRAVKRFDSVQIGSLAITRDRHRPRRWLLPPVPSEDEDPDTAVISCMPSRASQVALMRPAHLVVRYMQGDPHTSDEDEWAGCFICSDKPDIERAFADSEPPAHDDWAPSGLPKGSAAKSYVSTALREIDRRIGSRRPGPTIAPGGSNVGVARTADLLGRFIGDGTRVGGGRGSGGKGGGGAGGGSSGRRRKEAGEFRARPARFVTLEEGGEYGTAVFDVEVEGPEGHVVRLRAVPLIVADGSGEDATAPNGALPFVSSWSDAEGGTLSDNDGADIVLSGFNDIFMVRIRLPDYVAVTVRIEAEEVAE